MTPGRCSECRRSVIQTWHVDGSKVWLCIRCISRQMTEAFAELTDRTIYERLKKMGLIG